MIRCALTFGIFEKAFKTALAGVIVVSASGVAQAMDAGYCQSYSRAAVKEFYQANRACGQQSGGRWHDNFDVHFNWCLAQSYESTQSEWNARRALLQSCGYGAPAARPSGHATSGGNGCCPRSMLVCLPFGRRWC